MIDLVAGHTKVGFATTITTSPHIRTGKLRALGVGAAKRSAVLPDVPTIAEAGLPGYECANWIGIAAPTGIPATIVERLHGEIAAIQETAEFQQRLAAQGAETIRMSPTEFGDFILKEMSKWERVVKETGIKPE
jgi:tripartite-type tricarboxylate transporter receptor subunit TctC